MLLIHVPKLTNRLGYTLKVIFTHVLHAEYSITTDEQYFLTGGEGWHPAWGTRLFNYHRPEVLLTIGAGDIDRLVPELGIL